MAQSKRLARDPKAMIVDAEGFANAAEILRQNGATAAFIVNGALATEIALKAIAQVSNGSFLPVHNLRALFDDLPDDIRAAIVDAHRALAEEAGISDPDARLDGIIERNRDAFTRIRYLFDTAQDGAVVDLESPGPLLDACLHVLDRLRRQHGLPRGRHKLVGG